MSGSPSERRRAARYSETGAAVFALLRELDRIDDIWGRGDVSRSRLAVLRVLATEGAMTISDVARSRNTTRQGVQRLVAALVAQGWITSEENPRHRRAPLLRLTDAGLAAYQALSRAEAERLNEIARGLGADEVREATRVIAALRIRGAATAPVDISESTES